MKRKLKAWYAIWAALPLIPGLALAGIEGSKHDLSNESWSGGNKCGVCHTPHQSQPPKAAPLWNKDADLSRRFGTPLGEAEIAGSGTRSCLVCHDGTVAPATLSDAASDRGSRIMGTGHGTSNHPVGVAFPRVDRGFRDMNLVLASQTVKLPRERVECVSCHDPHNQSDQNHMLVTSNSRSALCLTCHQK